MTIGTVAKRLKEARQVTGLSQKGLGIKAGLDEFAASTRVNRYEQGVHEPDSVTASRLAEALGVPTAFFYAEDDDLAEMISLYWRLGSEARESLLKQLRSSVTAMSKT